MRLNKNKLPRLEGQRLIIRHLEPNEAGLMTKFRIENRYYLEPWEPKRNSDFFTER